MAGKLLRSKPWLIERRPTILIALGLMSMAWVLGGTIWLLVFLIGGGPWPQTSPTLLHGLAFGLLFLVAPLGTHLMMRLSPTLQGSERATSLRDLAWVLCVVVMLIGILIAPTESSTDPGVTAGRSSLSGKITLLSVLLFMHFPGIIIGAGVLFPSLEWIENSSNSPQE